MALGLALATLSTAQAPEPPVAVAARQIGGHLSDADYPRRELRARVGGTVLVRHRVAINGRVDDCVIATSSGSAALDDRTCFIIRSRFRYRVARNSEGRPTVQWFSSSWTWVPTPNIIVSRFEPVP